eukprot:Gb_08505 [translate_table: standard]
MHRACYHPLANACQHLALFACVRTCTTMKGGVEEKGEEVPHSSPSCNKVDDSQHCHNEAMSHLKDASKHRLTVMRCGHTMHRECLWILCNDHEIDSEMEDQDIRVETLELVRVDRQHSLQSGSIVSKTPKLVGRSIIVAIARKGRRSLLIVGVLLLLGTKWRKSSQQTLYPVRRPTGLAVATADNPGRPVDGVNTIGMLLTSTKADTEAGYPGIPTEDEGRDPDYFSLACLETRQRFRCGGVLDGHIEMSKQCNNM